MRIVFVDFDGVLNSDEYFAAHPAVNSTDADWWSAASLDPGAVQRLDRLITRADASIVLSTSWRKILTLDELSSILRELGFGGKLLGKTPTLYTSPDGVRFTRGHEIQAWLDANLQTSSFVILEDSEPLSHLELRCVRTDPALGLTDMDVDRALALLNQ